MTLHRTPPPELECFLTVCILGEEHTVGGWVRTCSAHGLNLRSCRPLGIYSRNEGGLEGRSQGKWRERNPRQPKCKRIIVLVRAATDVRSKNQNFVSKFPNNFMTRDTKRVFRVECKSLRTPEDKMKFQYFEAHCKATNNYFLFSCNVFVLLFSPCCDGWLQSFPLIHLLGISCEMNNFN